MADFRTSSGPAESDLEREAAEWFFRRDAGFEPGQEQAFERWLADERHRAAFAAIEQTWKQLEGVPVPVEGGVNVRQTMERSRRWGLLGLAAAAALALGIWIVGRPETRSPQFAEQAATEVGGLRHLDLPDGTVVTLNTDTSVDVQFTAAERRVRLLRGEAHFAVAPNPARPFRVEANGVVVGAVGTAFNVRMRAAAVEVLVTEGRVRVDDQARGGSLLTSAATAGAAPAGSPTLLTAGQRVTIVLASAGAPAAGPISAVPELEMGKSLAWQKRQLVYDDAPLAEIIADFNRYNRHQLVIVDPRLAGQRFGGTFPAGDFAALVQVLEQVFGVRAERRDRETTLRLP